MFVYIFIFIMYIYLCIHIFYYVYIVYISDKKKLGELFLYSFECGTKILIRKLGKRIENIVIDKFSVLFII